MDNVNEYQQKYEELKEAVRDFEANLPATMTIVDGEIRLNEKVFFISTVRYGDKIKPLHLTFKPANPKLFKADILTLIDGLKVEYHNPYKLKDNERPNAEIFHSAEFRKAFGKLSKHDLFFSLVLANLIREYVDNPFKIEKIIEHIFYDGIESSDFLLKTDSLYFGFFRNAEESSHISFGQMELADFEAYKEDISESTYYKNYFNEIIKS